MTKLVSSNFKNGRAYRSGEMTNFEICSFPIHYLCDCPEGATDAPSH